MVFSAIGWTLGTIVKVVLTVAFHLPEAVGVWVADSWRERRTTSAQERWRSYFRHHDASPTFLGLAATVMQGALAVWVILAMHN